MPYDHFVPRVYLKNWLPRPEVGNLLCYDKEIGEARCCSIRQICGEIDHDRLNYTGDKSLATCRTEVEKRFPGMISMLCNERSDPRLYRFLSQFVALQLTTTPVGLEWVASGFAKARMPAIQRNYSQVLINYHCRVTHNPDVAKHVAATGAMPYARMAFERSPWTIWKTRSPLFYTSDTPCIPYPFLLKDVKYVVMPLTPQLCVKIDCRKDVDESFPLLPSVQFSAADMSEVEQTNAPIFAHAKKYVIECGQGDFKFKPQQPPLAGA